MHSIFFEIIRILFFILSYRYEILNFYFTIKLIINDGTKKIEKREKMKYNENNVLNKMLQTNYFGNNKSILEIYIIFY